MSKFIKMCLAVMLIASCSKQDENNPNLTITTDNGEVLYTVEEAQTPAELEKGLMFRETLAADSGMIFDLSGVTNAAMWMKNTKIPLDMVFIDQDGVISWIYENAEPESTNFIIPPFPVTTVLEINAGDVQKHGIKVGDTVKHKFIKTTEDGTASDETAAPTEDEGSEETSDAEDTAQAEDTPEKASEESKTEAMVE